MLKALWFTILLILSAMAGNSRRAGALLGQL